MPGAPRSVVPTSLASLSLQKGSWNHDADADDTVFVVSTPAAWTPGFTSLELRLASQCDRTGAGFTRPFRQTDKRNIAATSVLLD